MDALLPMDNLYLNAKLLVYVLGKVLCAVDAAMLSSGASEAEHE